MKIRMVRFGRLLAGLLVLAGRGVSPAGLGPPPDGRPWEAEIDRWMKQQFTMLEYRARKRLYDRVQEVVANLPLICLASPNILVGAKSNLGNFRPAILDHYTLWNAVELFGRGK